MTPQWKTLSERQAEHRTRFADGVRRLEVRLADYGKAHKGAFHLFGSAVSGPIHDASDVDILVDFSPDAVFAACEFAEKACFELGLQPDVRPMIWASDRLKDRALTSGRSCP
jgi:predicted nucleotidyltransferase